MHVPHSSRIRPVIRLVCQDFFAPPLLVACSNDDVDVRDVLEVVGRRAGREGSPGAGASRNHPSGRRVLGLEEKGETHVHDRSS